SRRLSYLFLFSYHTTTPHLSTFSLHDALPIFCVTIFVILVVWFLLPRVARLMIHTPTAISIFVCLSMVQLMAVFISLATLGSKRSEERFSRNAETDFVCRLLLVTKQRLMS